MEKFICEQTASYLESGNVAAKDILVRLAGKTYALTVGTAQYLADIQTLNSRMDVGQRFQDSVFVVDAALLADSQKLCEFLSGLEFSELLPFLEEQEDF